MRTSLKVLNKIISTDLLKIHINLLNGKSYAAWKTKLKALWVRNELWGIVKKPRPKEVTNEMSERNQTTKLWLLPHSVWKIHNY